MSRKKGSHLTYKERCQIEPLLKSGNSKRATAKIINVCHSTVSRETRRNRGKGKYCHEQAHRTASLRRSLSNSARRRLTSEIEAKIIEMLKSTQASPQQISGRLKLMHNIAISHETIYKFIRADKRSGGTLYLHLRRRAKKYNQRKGKLAGRGLIPNRVDIDQRPKEVEEKARFGDFELDTIVGKDHKGAIVSVVDRATKLASLSLVPDFKAETVKTAIVKSFKKLSRKKSLLTMTSDNGKEFSQHKEIAKRLGVKFFFAKPYHSWERGLNEHTNGLVRQYLPKKTDFTKLDKRQVKTIQKILNNRPRASLNFQTPLERVFSLCPELPSGALRI